MSAIVDGATPGPVARPRVVVGIDGSTGARLALVWALTEAARRGTDVEVVTAFPVDLVWTDPTLLDGNRIDAIRADTEARAREMVDEVRHGAEIASLPEAADIAVAVHVCPGPAAAHLVERSAGAGLLVVGSRGRGAVRSTLAGSVALHCSAHARCPVVVVHPMTGPPDEPPRVLVGLDDSAAGRAALTTAVAHAAAAGARVDAVVAYEPPNYWSDLYAVLAPPLGETGAQAAARGEKIVGEVLDPALRGTVRVIAVEGHPAQALEREARGARLLVVGSRSRNQLQGVVLGSVALHAVMHAPCPVLVVRPRPSPRSPVPAEEVDSPALLSG